jgi:hypothetical protein
MKRKILTTILVVCCIVVGMAAVIADMNGKWAATFNAPDGNQYPLTYTFNISGDKLTGTLEASGMSIPIDSGKVSGDNVSFNVTVESTTYAHTGKYYSAADSIGVDVSFAGTKQHMTLTRPK